MVTRWLQRVVEARPVGTFFVLAYALSWVVWAPTVLGLGGETVLGLAGSFGPAVAGAVVTWLAGDSVRAWVGQIVRWRLRGRWYVVAFVLVVATGGRLRYDGSGPTPPE